MTWPVKRSPRAKANADKRAQRMRNKIRNYLQEEGISQKEFNKRCDCPQVTMSRFMSGQMSSGSFAYARAQKYFRNH